ncbi:MAG: type II toxin-antitoxin system RelE/ParE family toxin [Dysgonamonadaceae bacterium]|jgi:mRNA interferase RelE/StbE|nr:type II toxin-antitoxin system RelE/ParE family toxin [Dysgonamonadaceae bacterium]
MPWALANNPRPEGYKKLIGSQNTYRIRAGIYRIIYTIEDKILTVKVVKIDHRKTVTGKITHKLITNTT